jgi:signal transduction histidine kinase
MGYILSERAYAMSRDYAATSAEAEHEVIRKSLFESVRLSEGVFAEIKPDNLAVTVRPYADFYAGQGVYFNIYLDGVPAYGNAPFEADADGYDIPQGTRVTEMKSVDGGLYCFVASRLDAPHESILYVYIKDEQALLDFKNGMAEVFAAVGAVTGLVLSAVTLLLLIGLTRPLRRLNAAVEEIGAGNYDRRVPINSRDEIGDFARGFNLMADRVREHVSELSRMSESRQRFIDNLAHEIRTPVTAIVGYGELLKYANCDESEKETAIGHIVGAGRRIQNISLKLLDLAYMENTHIRMSALPLAEIFANALAALDLRVKEKGIDIRARIDPVEVVGDGDLLESLFVNLLDNAIEASVVGGAVDIRVTRTSGGVSVEIADNGAGMAAQELKRITEPFYRADKSRSGGGSHAGLGLTLCAKICQLHGAVFDIESKPGKGTTAKILFTTPQQSVDDSET